jgi:hypothetical protein
MSEQFPEKTVLAPSLVSCVYRVPITILCWQVSPGYPCPEYIQYPAEKLIVTYRGGSS